MENTGAGAWWVDRVSLRDVDGGLRLEVRCGGLRLGEVGAASLCAWLEAGVPQALASLPAEQRGAVVAWVDLRGSLVGDGGLFRLLTCLEMLGAKAARLFLSGCALSPASVPVLQRLASAAPGLLELRLADNALDDDAAFGVLSSAAAAAARKGRPTCVMLARNAVRDPAGLLERLRRAGAAALLAEEMPAAGQQHGVQLVLPGLCDQPLAPGCQGLAAAPAVGDAPDTPERRQAAAERLVEALAALTEAAAAGAGVNPEDILQEVEEGGQFRKGEGVDVGTSAVSQAGAPTGGTSLTPSAGRFAPPGPGQRTDWDPYLGGAPPAAAPVQPSGDDDDDTEAEDWPPGGTAPTVEAAGWALVEDGEPWLPPAQEDATVSISLEGLAPAAGDPRRHADPVQASGAPLDTVSAPLAGAGRPRDPRVTESAIAAEVSATAAALPPGLGLPTRAVDARGGGASAAVGQDHSRLLAEYEARLLGDGGSADDAGAASKRPAEEEDAPWRSQRRRMRAPGVLYL